jgi:hypothetical protein
MTTTNIINTNPVRENRGTTIVYQFNWRNPDKSLKNLTGYTASLMDVSTEIADFLTVVITNASTGLITWTLAWDDSLGQSPETKYMFRVLLTHATDTPRSTNLFEVTYQ